MFCEKYNEMVVVKGKKGAYDKNGRKLAKGKKRESNLNASSSSVKKDEGKQASQIEEAEKNNEKIVLPPLSSSNNNNNDIPSARDSLEDDKESPRNAVENKPLSYEETLLTPNKSNPEDDVADDARVPSLSGVLNKVRIVKVFGLDFATLVRTQRCFNVHTTSIRRRSNVHTTSIRRWNDVVLTLKQRKNKKRKE